MCGIAGLISHKGPESLILEKLNAASSCLDHRGPDGLGLEVITLTNDIKVSLAHRRLAILDLSDSGLQPFQCPEKCHFLTFNGEIYNYVEIRKELVSLGVEFRTTSDTEVLLHALKTWGRGALEKLEGMFAFAYLDKLQESLLLVRDRFGIKPLYYSEIEGSIGFASEPRALRKLFPQLNRVNRKVASDFLLFGYNDLTSDTFFEGISSLLPGHLCEIDLKSPGVKVQPEVYWQPEGTSAQNLTFEDASSEFRRLLLESVALHLRSDVPVGAALSGGLDSSTIVSIARHLNPDSEIHTFSYIASNSSVSEEVWVDEANSWIGATAHKVKIDPDELFERDLDHLIRAQGEPFSTLSIYAQFKVFQLAKEQGIKVTLDGQGADEILAGYQGFPEARIKSLLESGKVASIPQFVRAWKSWPGRSLYQLFTVFVATNFPWLRRSRFFIKFAGALNLVSDHNLEYFTNEAKSFASVNVGPGFSRTYRGRRLTEALIQALGTTRLTALLRYADRNSMYSSVESRVPFLNKALVEFALSLPEDFLLGNNGETKRILRAAMRGIVPDAILDRKDKIGFEASTSGWGKGSELILRISDDLSGIPLLNQHECRKALAALYLGQKEMDSNLWRVINFARWFRLENLAE